MGWPQSGALHPRRDGSLRRGAVRRPTRDEQQSKQDRPNAASHDRGSVRRAGAATMPSCTRTFAGRWWGHAWWGRPGGGARLHAAVSGHRPAVGDDHVLALIVMTGAIPFLMLAFWEFGGLTPTPLARLAQVGGWLAVGCGASPVCCPFSASSTSIHGACDRRLRRRGGGADRDRAVDRRRNLLAGPWLSAFRWLGFLAGLGVGAVCSLARW